MVKRGMKIYVQGLDGLVKQLDGLKNVEEKLAPGRMKAAEIVRSAIEGEAPLGPTGNLKRSIEINPATLTKKPDNIVFVASNHKIAPHAHLVEFGIAGRAVAKTRGRGFFTRGYRKSRKAAAEALAADIPAAIDKVL